MKILSIETSCDETAIALVEVNISDSKIEAKTIHSELFSQIDIHKEFGGVFPAIAKREHAIHLPILLEKILKNPGLVAGSPDANTETLGRARDASASIWSEIELLLSREIGLFEKTKKIFLENPRPEIDMIAVTQGPGLEPALWVGISFARALSLYWNIPLIGTNHMKGHIFSVLLNQQNIEFPALALLISGGHTELVEMTSVSEFNIIGKTKDDAVGESYDKVARMLGFEYPGGPKIAELAALARQSNIGSGPITLPRPMLHTSDLDFSFSGLKTAVLYKTKEFEFLDDNTKMQIAHEFEQAVCDVILKKIQKALDQKIYKTLIASGGVIANSYLRQNLQELADKNSLTLLLPMMNDSTDNAQMIAVAGAIDSINHKPSINPEIRASGNLLY